MVLGKSFGTAAHTHTHLNVENQIRLYKNKNKPENFIKLATDYKSSVVVYIKAILFKNIAYIGILQNQR